MKTINWGTVSYEGPRIVKVMKIKLFNWTFHLSRMMEDVLWEQRIDSKKMDRKSKIVEEPSFEKISVICNGKLDSEILLILYLEQESVKFMSKYHHLLSSSCNWWARTTTTFFPGAYVSVTYGKLPTLVIACSSGNYVNVCRHGLVQPLLQICVKPCQHSTYH